MGAAASMATSTADRLKNILVNHNLQQQLPLPQQQTQQQKDDIRPLINQQEAVLNGTNQTGDSVLQVQGDTTTTSTLNCNAPSGEHNKVNFSHNNHDKNVCRRNSLLSSESKDGFDNQHHKNETLRKDYAQANIKREANTRAQINHYDCEGRSPSTSASTSFSTERDSPAAAGIELQLTSSSIKTQ